MSKPDVKLIKNRQRLCKALIKQGCYLFPIKRHRKLPKGMWSQISTNDLETVLGWLNSKLNIGIDTGKSGLLVIDLDPKDETADEMQDFLEMMYEKMPHTFTIETPSGGRHFYFKNPEGSGLGNTQGALLPHVDTRGIGGYVVGPYSNIIPKAQAEELLVEKVFKSENGPINYQDFDYQTLYKEDLDWQYYLRASSGPVKFAEIPKAFLTKLLEVKESPTKGVASEVDEDAMDTNQAIDGAIDYCLNQHPPSVEGDGGNTTTYQLFTRLRDMGLTEELVVEIAYDYYNDRCDPPWDLEELMAIAEHAYAYAKEPLGIMSAHADFRSDDEDFYDPEVLQIVIPETGEVLHPKRNEERAEKPIAEKTKERKEEKHKEKVTAVEREANRLSLAFSSDKASKIRYVYVAAEDEVYNRLSGTVLKPAAFNRSKRLEYMQYMEDNKVGAFEAAEDLGTLAHAESFKYEPGQPIFMPHPVDPQAIVWNTYRAPDIEPIQGATPHFDAYLDALFIKPGDREVVLKFLAFTVQNLVDIHSFALVIFGNHGSGKTLLGELLGAMVGESNFGIVSAPDIKSQFNGWAMDRQVILLDECFDLGTLEIANKLKTHIGAKTIPINRKNKNMIDVVNYANFIITSNYTDAVRMDQGERRYYVIETNRDLGAKNPDTVSILNPIFDMARRRTAEGKAELSAVFHMLQSLDLSDYHPNTLPRRTEAMEHMIEANRSDWQSFLTDSIDNYDNGFHYSAYAIPDVVKLLKQEGFNKVRPGMIESYLVNQGFSVYKQCRCRPANAKHDYRKDVVVLHDQETWNDVTSVKVALADYCYSHSSQATEYATEDTKVPTVKKFLKTYQAGNTVTKIK